ncbi:MAG TPA: Calx-beta domain-containing protein [Pyrinomonadaceae bacterium]|nr:Calx-beta domain-containing protein [Pyrinomonadaceae bacterium]
MNRQFIPLRHACLALCLLAVVACAVAFSPSGASQVKSGADFHQEVSRVLSRYESLPLDAGSVERQVRQTGRLTLETSEGTFDISLAPHDMRADDYRAVAVLDGGVERELPRAPARTFKGTVRGLSGGQARFTIDGETIEGMILAHGEKFFVEPAARYSGAAPSGAYLFYRESAVIGGEAFECGVETLSDKVNAELSRVQSDATGGVRPEAVLSPQREADIATDADFEYTQAFGSPAAANNDILTILNQVEGVYQSQIGLTFNVIFQRAWDTPNDPYDAASLSGLLAQVEAHWISNPPAGAANRDLLHMWTGRNLTEGAGFARIGAVCNSQRMAVGVSELRTAAPSKYVIPAHEIGHNFGADHPEKTGHAECALTIMSGLTEPATLFNFCQFSRDEITNYINANNGCLSVATTPAATVQFGALDYRVTEGTSAVQISVTRTGDTSSAVSVNYDTSDGSASERSDYTTAVGTLRFVAGETTKTFNVFITDDAYGEGLETFQIVLSNASGATVGTPSSASVTITSNEAVNGANPVKDPSFNSDFFVRQHYIDFFNREADAGGLAFWRNQIDECTTQACRETRRINVSAAFFVSGEYQETGFYAIRIQRAAFGKRSNQAATRMTYRELIRDQRQIGEGVVIGQAGAEQQLEANKQAYATQVVSSAAFAARFPQTSGDAYVDALYASAGVTPTATERQEAIAAYGAGGVSGRTAALRRVAESSSLRNAELSPAFVLLQYHGYLRRNPTDSPNTDDSGYQFWLGKLNQFGGNYIAAEMVKAFITSTEYQQRFGPS